MPKSRLTVNTLYSIIVFFGVFTWGYFTRTNQVFKVWIRNIYIVFFFLPNWAIDYQLYWAWVELVQRRWFMWPFFHGFVWGACIEAGLHRTQDHFTNDFSIVIQIRWEINSALIRVVVKWSLWNLANGTIAVLSCHLQYFVAIWYHTIGLYQKQLSSNLNYDGKIVREMVLTWQGDP